MNGQVRLMPGNVARQNMTYLEQCVVPIVNKGEVLEPANPVWNVLDKEPCYLQQK